MKEYRGKIIITSIITLLPMIVGLVLWNKLPDSIATHWGLSNEPNGWSSREMVVFGIPVILTFFHLIAVVGTTLDPKKKNISKKMFNIVLWIIPIISWIVMIIIYASALGHDVNIGLIINILMGILFIVIGNYLPKSKQNYTVGIKLPWTLDDKENWNKTNRLSGYLFVISGLAFLVNSIFLTMIPIIFVVLAVFIPAIYSYILYKN